MKSDRITYPPELPITERRAEILDALVSNQVVVVAGETGSGKSTQLPKFCLEALADDDRLIGHTQPRRLAARSIAERLAAELGTTVGGLVGYTVRFHDEVGADTRIRLMTDGILLAEIQRDPMLRRYRTLIIDEAHERSLNIDFLLGYLARLLPQRPDLNLIITSATIDTERFSAHFDGAPIIEVSGRTYPVEVRYQPPANPNDPEAPNLDQPEAIEQAVRELLRDQPGDMLVFCSGEREIHDAADHLRDQKLGDLEILPLYARLSPAEQQRIFKPAGKRRVILSTNVAETSLTVPGIHAVIDTGLARISRFNRRTKVQRLPIEPISQASANQRAGRCGRLGPGVCIRLYAEDEFNARPDFTEPEIQRTNLASVILQMAALGLGDVANFPFVDPPDMRAVRDGILLLEELDAVTPEHEGENGWLTPLGRQLSSLPLDPRMGRMLLEAEDHGCVRELLIIVSGLSIQDPRIRPNGVGSGAAQQKAAEFHQRYTDDESDFLSYLLLWEHTRIERAARSGNGFRRMCRDEYLHFLRIREWQDVHSQLRRSARELGLQINDNDAPPMAIHQAVLAGLLSHIGFFDPERREYRGARNARFVVAPGSALRKRTPKWVMAGELVETNQLRARTVAPLNPRWLEQSASHLMRWDYSDPWWDEHRGAAMCHERASLYGLPVVPNRAINLHRVDPALARALFVRNALVEIDPTQVPSTPNYEFVRSNATVTDEIVELEHRLRRHDLHCSDDEYVDRYVALLPDNVVSRAHFEKWWSKHRRQHPTALDLALVDLVGDGVGPIESMELPNSWSYGDLDLAVDYQFDPAEPTDGLTIDVPLEHVRRLRPQPFEWLVPAWRPLMIEELIRTLPKATRRTLLPIPETVAEVVPHLDPTGDASLATQLAAALTRHGGVDVQPHEFRPASLPTYLRPHFRVVDQGESLAEDDDLELLQRHLHEEARELLAKTSHSLERTGLTDWDFGDFPESVEATGLGQPVTSYPTLIDDGDSVSIRLVADLDTQTSMMWEGTRRLLLLHRPPVGRVLRNLLTEDVKYAIVVSPYDSPSSWFDDCLIASTDEVLHRHGGPVFGEAGWKRLIGAYRSELAQALMDVANEGVEVLHRARDLRRSLDSLTAPALQPARSDMAEQLDRLVYDGSLAAVGAHRLGDVGRYLHGIEWRLGRITDGLARDRDRMANVRALETHHEALVQQFGMTEKLESLMWQLQELRVSQFAESIGAAGAVSVKRVRFELERLTQGTSA